MFIHPNPAARRSRANNRRARPSPFHFHSKFVVALAHRQQAAGSRWRPLSLQFKLHQRHHQVEASSGGRALYLMPARLTRSAARVTSGVGLLAMRRRPRAPPLHTSRPGAVQALGRPLGHFRGVSRNSFVRVCAAIFSIATHTTPALRNRRADDERKRKRTNKRAA